MHWLWLSIYFHVKAYSPNTLATKATSATKTPKAAHSPIVQWHITILAMYSTDGLVRRGLFFAQICIEFHSAHYIDLRFLTIL